MLARLLLLLCLAGGLSKVVADSTQRPKVCFVVRTYAGHSAKETSKSSLPNFLQSLADQTDPRWTALLVVLDSRPFTDLADIIRDFNDTRINIFAEWAGAQYAAQEANGMWKKTYHALLYNLTDYAIRACPSDAEWVVATNGDNVYDSRFVEHVLTAPPDAHIVAVDFYSRFTAEPGMPLCKVNELRFCQVDLAAMALDLKRLIREDRRFGTIDKTGNSDGADGLMAGVLVQSGWQAHHIHQCLVAHSPNPQLCAMQGGVWDDSAMVDFSTFGGKCLTKAQQAAKMQAEPGVYVVQHVDLSFDPTTFGLEDQHQLEIECLSRADKSWHGPFVFGHTCAAREDFHLLPDMPAHFLDHLLPADLQAELAKKRGKKGNKNAQRMTAPATQ